MSNIYEGKKVFVPGGSGMVGHVLCQMLQEAGAEVFVAGMDEPSRAPEGVTYHKATAWSFVRVWTMCSI